jgi:topoisomerase-4 subunit B
MDSTNKSNGDTVQTLEWYEHIRLNVEKYIGKIGDGSSPDDGIYTLLKGLIDCSVDEYEMGWAKELEIENNSLVVYLREYGRGIPLKSVVYTTSGLSVGIGAKKDVVATNGYKVANALAEEFLINSYRNAERSWALYFKGVLDNQGIEVDEDQEPDGTWVKFSFDKELFPNSYYRQEIVNDIVKQYAEKYNGFSITLNGVKL